MKGDLKQRIGKDSRTQAGRTSLIAKIKNENKYLENAAAKKEFLKVIDTTVYQGKWEAKKAEKLGNKELFKLGERKNTLKMILLHTLNLTKLLVQKWITICFYSKCIKIL